MNIEWKECDGPGEVRKPSFRAELGGVRLHVCLDFDQETWCATAGMTQHCNKASFEHKTKEVAIESARRLGAELINAEILRLVSLYGKFAS